MTRSRWSCAVAGAALVLVGCSGGGGATGERVGPTALEVSRADSDAPDGSTPPEVSPTVATVPATPPDVSVSDATGASVAPTATSPAIDAATGLRVAAPAAGAPTGVVPDDPSGNQATIYIEAGSQSYAASGGSCSVIDGYSYVFVGEVDGMNATLSWQTDAPAVGQYLTWRYTSSPDSSLVSTHGIDRDDGIRITFGPDGESGSFAGWYYLVESQTFWEFEGSFSCMSAPVFIDGDHPASFVDARCTAEGISAGGTGASDAANLQVDTEHLDASGGHVGALVWRVGGVVYESNWLLVRLTPDGLGGSFVGTAVGPDGAEFDVSGSFNCLAG